MSARMTAIAPAFGDPTRGAQRAFRAVLEALARPTRSYPIAGPAETPAPLAPAAAAVALTLCDEQTPVWLDAALTGTAAADWIVFHTGAPLVTAPRDAAFAFATGFATLPPLADFAQGTHEQPHLSTTVVVDVRGGTGNARFTATGPGIPDTAALEAAWASKDFAKQWQRNTAQFPLGVDLVLVGESTVQGLPRTTRLASIDGGN